LIRKSLSDGHEALVGAGWDYKEDSDKALSGFRCLYKAIVRLDKAIVHDAEVLLAIFQNDWLNLMQALISLHESRKSLRAQTTYVVEKLSVLSAEFLTVSRGEASLPWEPRTSATSRNPHSPESHPESIDESTLSEVSCNPFSISEQPSKPFSLSEKSTNPFSLSEDASNPFSLSEKSSNPLSMSDEASNPFTLSQKTWVLVRVGAHQPGPKSLQISQSDGLETHRFLEDASCSNTSFHISVLAHIMDLICNQQETKQLVSVIIDSPTRHEYMFQDIRNLFQARGLEIPKFITSDPRAKKGCAAEVSVVSSQKDAREIVHCEISRRESAL
jgi:hypothetical protein